MNELAPSLSGEDGLSLAVVPNEVMNTELIGKHRLPLTGNFGNAVRWNFVGTLLRVGMSIVCQLLLMRILGPEIAGQNAIFMIIVGIGSILSEGGMLAALMRVPEITKPVLRNAIFLILVYSGSVTLALVLASRFLVHLFALSRSEIFIPLVAAFTVIPQALSSVPISVLKRNYRAKEIQIVQLSAYFICYLCVGLPIALLHASVVAMMTAFTLQTVLVVVALWIAARCPLLPLARGTGAIRGTSLKGLTANISYFFNESVANVMTAHFLGTVEVGLYGTSGNLGRMPTDALINTFHGPLMASAARGEEEVGLRFLNTMNAISVVVLPCYLVVSLCAQSILIPLLGDKWLGASPVFAVIVLAMLCRLLGMLGGSILWGKGALFTDIYSQVVALGSFLILFLFIRPQTGERVAVLTLVAWGLRMAIQTISAARVLSLSASQMVRSFVVPGVVSLIFVLPLRWMHSQFVDRPTIGDLVWLGLVGVVLFVIRVAIAIRFDGSEWTRAVAARLPSPLRGRLLRPAFDQN